MRYTLVSCVFPARGDISVMLALVAFSIFNFDKGAVIVRLLVLLEA